MTGYMPIGSTFTYQTFPRSWTRVGGFGYAVSHSIDPPLEEPYAGLAELYFPDEDGWERYKALIRPDGMERWVESKGTVVLGARTEMIGIP